MNGSSSSSMGTSDLNFRPALASTKCLDVVDDLVELWVRSSSTPKPVGIGRIGGVVVVSGAVVVCAGCCCWRAVVAAVKREGAPAIRIAAATMPPMIANPGPGVAGRRWWHRTLDQPWPPLDRWVGRKPCGAAGPGPRVGLSGALVGHEVTMIHVADPPTTSAATSAGRRTRQSGQASRSDAQGAADQRRRPPRRLVVVVAGAVLSAPKASTMPMPRCSAMIPWPLMTVRLSRARVELLWVRLRLERGVVLEDGDGRHVGQRLGHLDVDRLGLPARRGAG